jgi:hypothetical protein
VDKLAMVAGTVLALLGVAALSKKRAGGGGGSGDGDALKAIQQRQLADGTAAANVDDVSVLAVCCCPTVALALRWHCCAPLAVCSRRRPRPTWGCTLYLLLLVLVTCY